MVGTQVVAKSNRTEWQQQSVMGVGVITDEHLPTNVQENTVAALLLLSTFLYNVRRLFGVRFDVLGGLISDHANSFLNAYQKVFPNRPVGQCFPRVQLKVLDQPGRRKRGSAGYVQIIRDRKNLTTAAKDVKRMHCNPTDAAKKTFTSLALRAWKLIENKMAQVFSKSYIQSLPHSRWGLEI
jgi:hypothetical protein